MSPDGLCWDYYPGTSLIFVLTATSLMTGYPWMKYKNAWSQMSCRVDLKIELWENSPRNIALVYTFTTLLCHRSIAACPFLLPYHDFVGSRTLITGIHRDFVTAFVLILNWSIEAPWGYDKISRDHVKVRTVCIIFAIYILHVREKSKPSNLKWTTRGTREWKWC